MISVLRPFIVAVNSAFALARVSNCMRLNCLVAATAVSVGSSFYVRCLRI